MKFLYRLTDIPYPKGYSKKIKEYELAMGKYQKGECEKPEFPFKSEEMPKSGRVQTAYADYNDRKLKTILVDYGSPKGFTNLKGYREFNLLPDGSYAVDYYIS